MGNVTGFFLFFCFFVFFFEEDEATKPSFVYKMISNINRKEIQQVLKEDQVMALSSAF